MEKSKILQSDFLDIIFENRNKAYGAYDLRRSYRKHITYAITGMLMIAAAFSLLLQLKQDKDSTTKTFITREIDLQSVSETKSQVVMPLQPVEKVKPQTIKLKTTQFSTLKIVDDRMVKETVKSQHDLSNARIAAFTQEGLETNAVAPAVQIKGEGGNTFEHIAASVTSKKIEEEIFIDVQVKASYRGDWDNFLRRNLNADLPVENGAPPGTYRVIVGFTVAKNGKVSDVKALNDPGYGTAAEAVRVIKASGDWEPGIQNNTKVSSRHKQAIVFVVE